MPTTFVNDDFFGTLGADLSRIPIPTGGQWTKVPGYTTSITLDGASAAVLATTPSVWAAYENATVASDEKTVITLIAKSSVAAGDAGIALMTRSNAEQAGYWVSIDRASSDTLHRLFLYRVNSGAVYTQLGSTISVAANPLNTTYKNLVLTVTGTNPVLISVDWGGVNYINNFSDSDSARITAAGKVQFWLLGRGMADNYSATYEPAGGATTVKKFRIPTTVADGTQRYLWVFADSTRATELVSNQLVTASGGFFKYAYPSTTVGLGYPCFLGTWGSDSLSAAFGGPAWAAGIEE